VLIACRIRKEKYKAPPHNQVLILIPNEDGFEKKKKYKLLL